MLLFSRRALAAGSWLPTAPLNAAMNPQIVPQCVVVASRLTSRHGQLRLRPSQLPPSLPPLVRCAQPPPPSPGIGAQRPSPPLHLAIPSRPYLIPPGTLCALQQALSRPRQCLQAKPASQPWQQLLRKHRKERRPVERRALRCLLCWPSRWRLPMANAVLWQCPRLSRPARLWWPGAQPMPASRTAQWAPSARAPEAAATARLCTRLVAVYRGSMWTSVPGHRMDRGRSWLLPLPPRHCPPPAPTAYPRLLLRLLRGSAASPA
mmetsp:Transcript_20522/g.52052  ORF Transcript_20522/g.52052 Transcript_20522/m.52052 type:complete len:263 (-) Transcript_20522:1091-1879(-)